MPTKMPRQKKMAWPRKPPTDINQINDDCLLMILNELPLEEQLLRARWVSSKWRWAVEQLCYRKQHLLLFVTNKWTVDHLASHRYNIPINMFEYMRYCKHCRDAIRTGPSNSFLRIPSGNVALFNRQIAPMFPNLQMLFLRYMNFETQPLCELLARFTLPGRLNRIKCLILLLPYHAEKKGQIEWPCLSLSLSMNFIELRHFATSGILPDQSAKGPHCDWSFLTRVSQLNLTNCVKLPSVEMYPKLTEVSLHMKPDTLNNLPSSLTFLDINFPDPSIMFTRANFEVLAELKSLKELRLHNYNSFYTQALDDFYRLPNICRSYMVKLKSVQSLTLDFFFDPAFLPRFLETLFPNLVQLNVSFMKLPSYEMLDYLDQSFPSFCAWINGVFAGSQRYLSVKKYPDSVNNNNNVLYFDLSNCPYVHLEEYFMLANRFMLEKGKILHLILNNEQKKRLCRTLNTRIRKAVLPTNLFSKTRFSICSAASLVIARSMLESTFYFRVPSRHTRLRLLNDQ